MTRALRPEDISEDDLQVPQSGPYRILFVCGKRDESAPLLSHLERTSGGDLTFRPCATISEALSVLKGTVIDLIVLAQDVAAGQEFSGLRRVRAIYPNLPGIILSNTNNHSLAGSAKDENAQDFIITSPSSPIELIKLRLLCSIQRIRTEQSVRSIALNEKFILRSMVDEAPLMFARLDQSFCLCDCNRNFEEALKQRRAQLRGRSIFDLIPAFSIEEVEALFSGEQLYRKKIIMADRDVYWNCFGWTFSKRNPDEKENIIVAIDVTQEVELNMFREEFMASVIHDVRNPILGQEKVLSALVRSDANFSREEINTYLVKLRNSNLQLLNLLSTLVDSYRLEWGTASPSASGTDLNEVIQQQVDEFECLAMLSEKRLVVECADDLPAATIDHPSAYRLVANLVHNALQNAPAKTEIVISTDKKDRSVRVQVTNHGPPLKAGEKNKVFQRFSKMTDSGRFRANSSGLGLYFCKQTVDRCGGTIDFVSDADGTTFTVTLPIAKG